MFIFLITSLPILTLNQKPTISKKAFIKRVYNCLSNDKVKEFSTLERLDIDYMKQKNQYLTKFSSSFYRYRIKNTLQNTKSMILKAWLSFLLDLHDILTGILCKMHNMEKHDTLKYFKEVDGTVKNFVIKYYNKEGFDLSRRFKWFKKFYQEIQNNNLPGVENKIILLKLQKINEFKIFCIFF
jgi:hypothetical protein